MRRLMLVMLIVSGALLALTVREMAAGFAGSDRYSSYRGGRLGARALYLALSELGDDVVRAHESPEVLGLRGTLFLLLDREASGEIPARDWEPILDWVMEGNRLVAAHDGPLGLDERLGIRLEAGGVAEEAPARAARVRVGRLAATGLTAAIPAIVMREPGVYAVDHDRYLPLFGADRERPSALAVRHGAGEVVLFAGAWLFSNEGMLEPGSFELAAALAHRETPGSLSSVIFDERHHGFAARRNVLSYARHQGFTPLLLQLLIVGIVATLGPASRVEAMTRPAEWRGPGSGDYLRAMERIYSAARPAAEAAADLQRELRAALAERARRPRDAGTGSLLEALRGTLPEELLGEVGAALAVDSARRFEGRGGEGRLVGYHNRVLTLLKRVRGEPRGAPRGAHR